MLNKISIRRSEDNHKQSAEHILILLSTGIMEIRRSVNFFDKLIISADLQKNCLG